MLARAFWICCGVGIVWENFPMMACPILSAKYFVSSFENVSDGTPSHLLAVPISLPCPSQHSDSRTRKMPVRRGGSLHFRPGLRRAPARNSASTASHIVQPRSLPQMLDCRIEPSHFLAGPYPAPVSFPVRFPAPAASRRDLHHHPRWLSRPRRKYLQQIQIHGCF